MTAFQERGITRGSTTGKSLVTRIAMLADVWFDRAVSVVECRDPGLFDQVRTDGSVTVDADTCKIVVGRSSPFARGRSKRTERPIAIRCGRNRMIDRWV